MPDGLRVFAGAGSGAQHLRRWSPVAAGQSGRVRRAYQQADLHLRRGQSAGADDLDAAREGLQTRERGLTNHHLSRKDWLTSCQS